MSVYKKLVITAPAPLSPQELSLVPGQDSTLTVQYDSTYCVDKHTRVEENRLTVAYKEHPQRVRDHCQHGLALCYMQ